MVAAVTGLVSDSRDRVELIAANVLTYAPNATPTQVATFCWLEGQGVTVTSILAPRRPAVLARQPAPAFERDR